MTNLAGWQEWGVLEQRALRDALAERLQRTRRDAWQPYPWQVPPAEIPVHGTWLMLGGRGTGKTDGIARYVDEHMRGPACDRRVRGGHRIAVVAPTLGDAAESCVNGPSGLRAHNPAVRLKGGIGGGHVMWPSGAEGRLFGAYTPEDVERLRAGGNRSIATGTLVACEHGARPIEQVQTGDRVWTEAGLRPVLASMDHGQRATWTVTTAAGRTLRLTPDHQVWVCQQGWTRTDGLRPGDPLTALSGAATPGPARAAVPTTPAPSRSTAAPAAPSCCTGPSTRTTTDRYRTGTSSTTSTSASTTTSPATSPPSPAPSTSPTTPDRRSGTPAAAGTRSDEPSSPGRGAPNAATSAPAATPASAGSPAGERGSASTPRPPACGHAPCAAATSLAPPGPPPSLAHDRVVTVSHRSDAEPIWDLTVAGEHAFFADGLLVSNCLVWLEEVAAMRHLGPVLEHTGLGLRIGPRPHYVASTTPKPRKELRALLADPTTITTTGRTQEAWHLPLEVRERLYRLHKGTRLERQELEGVLIAEVEGALWSWRTIDAHRVDVPPADLTVIVSIDPAASNTETSDETGIVVLGCTADRIHGYVLEDVSGRYSPEGWAKAALDAAARWDADYLVAEKNMGGDMVGATLRSVDKTARVRLVTASKGKRLRAEPVSVLYEQGRVHHVGGLVALEEQMTVWVPAEKGDAGKSPDRIDALVHGLTDLMVPRRSGGFADAA